MDGCAFAAPLVWLDNVAPGDGDSGRTTPPGPSTFPSPFWYATLFFRVASPFRYAVGGRAGAFEVEGGTIPENEVKPTEDPDPGLEP